MKLLFIAPRFHTNLYHPIKALKEAGYEIAMLVSYIGESENHDVVRPHVIGYAPWWTFLQDRLKKFRKDTIHGLFSLKFAPPNGKLLRTSIDEQKPNVIILKDFQSIFSSYVLWCAFRRKIPVLLLVQTAKNHIKGSKILFKAYVRLLTSSGVVGILTPIKKTVDVFQSIKYEHIHYVPFIHPYVEYEKKYRIGGITKILCIGKFIRRKDHLLLMQAIKQLKDMYPLQVTLVGEKMDEAYRSELLDYIANASIENIVDIKYNVPYGEVQDLYKTHDLFVLPSYKEPAAVSIVEAMAYGLPVIVSSDCGTNCYVHEGVNGYIFRARDGKDLELKLELYFKDPKRLEGHGFESSYIAKRAHSPVAFLSIFKDILRNIYDEKIEI